jgi:ribosomal protein S18 acetylase RimI-like enzyme
MLEIRRYEAPDHDAVRDLNYLALAPTGAFVSGGELDRDLDEIEKQYLENRGEFLVGFSDGKLVCMGGLKKEQSTTAEIMRMRVHPQYQRRGFGQLLLSRLEQRARELGYNRLILKTSTRQVAAQALYEKNGFTEIRRGLLFGLEVIFYQKSLD